jgi:hypothetical protein
MSEQEQRLVEALEQIEASTHHWSRLVLRGAAIVERLTVEQARRPHPGPTGDDPR